MFSRALTAACAVALAWGAGCRVPGAPQPVEPLKPPPPSGPRRPAVSKAELQYRSIERGLKDRTKDDVTGILRRHVKNIPRECRGRKKHVILVPEAVGRVPSTRIPPGALVFVEPEDDDNEDEDQQEKPDREKDDAAPDRRRDTGDEKPLTATCAISLKRTRNGAGFTLNVESFGLTANTTEQGVHGEWSEHPPGHALLTLAYMKQTGGTGGGGGTGEPDHEYTYEELVLYVDGEFHPVEAIVTGFGAIRNPYPADGLSRELTWTGVMSRGGEVLAVSVRQTKTKDPDGDPHNGNETEHWTETYRLYRLDPVGKKLVRITGGERAQILKLPKLKRYAAPRRGVTRPKSRPSESKPSGSKPSDGPG